MDTFDDWFKRRHAKSGIYAQTLINDPVALDLKKEMRASWEAANKRAAAIAIRMTEIPKDAQNPTRDRIVEVGEYISEAILK